MNRIEGEFDLAVPYLNAREVLIELQEVPQLLKRLYTTNSRLNEIRQGMEKQALRVLSTGDIAAYKRLDNVAKGLFPYCKTFLEADKAKPFLVHNMSQLKTLLSIDVLEDDGSVESTKRKRDADKKKSNEDVLDMPHEKKSKRQRLRSSRANDQDLRSYLYQQRPAAQQSQKTTQILLYQQKIDKGLDKLMGP